MSKIKVGEYARTERGVIAKIIGYDDDNNFLLDNQQIITKIEAKSIKHSENQKELIQEGDILQYQIYKLSSFKIGEVKKYKDARSFDEYLGVEGFNLYQITILRILTKERFEKESYKVGE